MARSLSERIRLDALPNPYGPPEQVWDAIASDDPSRTSTEELHLRMRRELGAYIGVPESWVVLANGIDELHSMIVRWRSESGPLVTFPPTDPALDAWVEAHGVQVERIPRLNGFRMPVRDDLSHIPKGSTSIVMSPNDPSGTIITVQETVRLLRRCAVVVVDERHAAYSSRSVLPLVREWENMIVTQTFETFAGLTSLPLAWAIAPPRFTKEIAKRGRPSGIGRTSLVAGLATLDEMAAVQQSVRRVMAEKGRLFRQIRKLNMISAPYPSWSNFLICRFERGSSDFFLPRLEERGIDLYRPPHPNLRNHVRISAVSGEWTAALKNALIDIALDL
ncbi:MAG TPA: aminotransferase class I/II-fold pyridoxal phosphate-dependent enzyme [Thermomicrobiales bacterium]|nr:aminotransferase class I/II-fold pyridoxal phosphate-dependent enzyme [Thermomicrobiales bacterium]